MSSCRHTTQTLSEKGLARHLVDAKTKKKKRIRNKQTISVVRKRKRKEKNTVTERIARQGGFTFILWGI